MQIGDRVGAIASVKNIDGQKHATIYGFGVYVGDKVPPPNAGGFGGAILHKLGASNPAIQLDDGGEVFGCECWWGSESQVKSMLDGCSSVEVVSIDMVREALDEGEEE